MKIAYINTTASTRQAPGRLMLSLAEGALAAGHEVLVMYGRGEPEVPEGAEALRIGSNLGVAIHALGSRLADGEGHLSRRATRRALEALRRWRPDVVHLHNLHGHYLHLPTLMHELAEMGVPVVATLHDYWLLTGSCPFFSHLGCDGYLSGCRGHCPAKADYPQTLIARAAAGYSLKERLLHLPGLRLTVVAVSDAMGAQLRRMPSAGGLDIRVIANGVDTHFFCPDPAVEREPIILAVASRWDSRKRLDAVQGLAKLLYIRERLMVVGRVDGPKTGDIEYVGHVDTATLRDLYRRARVVVCPSGAETFGLTVAEAVACGAPVVTDAEAPLAHLATTANGADALSLRQAIDTAADLPPSPPAYTVEEMRREYLTLYNSLTTS